MRDSSQRPRAEKTFILLGVIYLSFIALGLPDGALGLAWPIMREDMGMSLGAVSILTTTASAFYVLISSQYGRISKYTGTDKANLLGISFLTMSFFVFFAAPNFALLVVMMVFVGTGSGLIDTGLNDYMSRHFSARHMNWMHCFWGLGAAISPIIMAQMILLAGWRMGYATIATIQGIVAVLVLASIAKGIWKRGEARQDPKTEAKVEAQEAPRRYLSAKRHGILQMLVFFFYVGIEASIGLWISSILIESRGLAINAAGIFPAAYFACIMAGRLLFGFAANKLGNMAIMRIGMAMAAIGIIILTFSNSVFGIALAGFGLAPVFPCLMHESSNRFDPAALTRLVGYQIAAAGVGSATFALSMGQILSRISLEALFPILLALAVLVAATNEVLAWKLRRA